MNLEDLVKTNPIVLLILALLGIVLIGYRLIPSINSLVAAALTRRGWSKGSTSETDIDPTAELMKSVQALVITIQLLIETNNQRDSAAAMRDNRMGNLADSVAEQTRSLGELTKSIGKIVLSSTEQTSQLADLTGRIGYANQLGEDTRGDLSKAVKIVDEQSKAIDEQTKKIGELKEQIEKLEKDVREDFLPTLHQIHEAIDSLVTKEELANVAHKTDLTEIGQISAKLNHVENELKAFIAKAIAPVVTNTITLPPPTDMPVPTSAVVEKPNESKVETALKPASEEKSNG